MEAEHTTPTTPAQPVAEPVAQVMPGWSLHWIGSEPIAHICARHPELRIGTKLYTIAPAASGARDALLAQARCVLAMMEKVPAAGDALLPEVRDLFTEIEVMRDTIARAEWEAS
jgi:hypothetical protein